MGKIHPRRTRQAVHNLMMASSKEDTLPKYENNTLTAKCHCGGITITIPSPPTLVNECQCSICFRYGASWSYYPARDIIITAEADHKTLQYIRDDLNTDRGISFNFCSRCGCMTHWKALVDGDSKEMGINMRMLPIEIWKDVEKEYENP